jgi:hypothetical protein
MAEEKKAAADAAIAETNGRRELKSEHLEFVLELPAKVPFVVIRYTSNDNIAGALEAILGSEQMERVWDADLDIEQGRELVEQIFSEYDLTAGK